MAQRARNLRRIYGEYGSDYFSESSADSETSNWDSEEEEDPGYHGGERSSRSKFRAPPRYPRPHSHLLRKRDGTHRGTRNKHSRRLENSIFISSLYQLPEEELKKGYSILPDHCSSFTKLHTDQESMKMWEQFTAYPEEEQGAILGGGKRSHIPQEGRDDRKREISAESCYKKIDRHIRSMLKHNRHLPYGFLEAVETELTDYFEADHSSLVVIIHHNTFYRLLVHGLCQYLGLCSTTLHQDGVSLMLLECGGGQFIPPPLSLVSHLTSHLS